MVGAYDNGNPRLNSTLVAVNFSIVDSNDNNPVFNPSTYAVSVEENATTGTEVVKVNASENDKLARIGYYIANGNHGNRFSINSTTVSDSSSKRCSKQIVLRFCGCCGGVISSTVQFLIYTEFTLTLLNMLYLNQFKFQPIKRTGFV